MKFFCIRTLSADGFCGIMTDNGENRKKMSVSCGTKENGESAMTAEAVKIDESSLRKLLGAANPDAALLYLYIYAGNAPESAEETLHISASRLSCAGATLRQLGLWPEERKSTILPGERPAYSETDVLSAMDRDLSFRGLYEEIQRVMGRSLNTEELKIILSFTNYLGLPADVIIMLVYFCRDRARQRGSSRSPSLRAIEKEAYIWAENGIDTIEEASAYIQNQNFRHSRLRSLMDTLQIRGRNLTQAEEKYAQQWLDQGFENAAVAMAYERTCLNTGGLNWAYMNKIMQRWSQQGLFTAEAIRNGDRKPQGATGQLGEAELEAIQRVLREG